MNVYTLIKKGEMHPVFCEDFILQIALGDSYHLFAVMDGCSSGKDSHFASTLFAKILAKASKEVSYLIWERGAEAFWTTEEVLREVLERFFEQLKKVRRNLSLQDSELLATLLLAVYHTREDKVLIIAIGDGFVVLNDKIIEIDQNNIPDYLTYHLDEDFGEWFAKQKNVFVLEKPQNLAISTDGVDTFIDKYNSPTKQELDPITFLLVDDSMKQLKNMLNRKFNILDRKHNLLPADDLGIIRVRFEDQ